MGYTRSRTRLERSITLSAYHLESLEENLRAVSEMWFPYALELDLIQLVLNDSR